MRRDVYSVGAVRIYARRTENSVWIVASERIFDISEAMIDTYVDVDVGF